MGLTRVSPKVTRHRRCKGHCEGVLLALLFLVTLCPIYYITFMTQPNTTKRQLNGRVNVREFQHANKLGMELEASMNGNNFRILNDSFINDKDDSLRKQNSNVEGNHSNITKWQVKTHTANETLKHRLAVEKLKRAHNTLCPTWPTELVGRLETVSADMVNMGIPTENLKGIAKGGLFHPPNCTAREKVAIIVPYRDRETHLQILLTHLHTVLQRQKLRYGIYVIEMAYPTQFNRGLLANVGFLTAASIGDFTCFIVHDVDHIMVDDRNIYRCGRVVRHLVAASSKYDDNLPYLSYFGGVSAFSTDQFWSVNGFSNLYFGLGGEDDDMVSRIISTGSHFSRPKKNIGGYVTLKNSKEGANPVNPHRLALLYSSNERKGVDGVKSVKYSRLALEFKPLYTWVLISVKEAKIMEKYQDFLQVSERLINKTKSGK